MIYDKDLNPVLKKCSNEELEILISFFVDKFSEGLTISDKYEKYYPNHKKYYDEIADEIRRYGGNSIANFFRDEGPAYKEIVCDVADELGVNYKESASIEKIEQAILEQLFKNEWEEMSKENQKEMLKSFGITDYSIIGENGVLALQFFIKNTGFFTYKYSVIILNQISRILFNKGLSFGTNALITSGIKAFSLMTPVTAVMSVFSAVNFLASPSYKVVIPSVIYVASLRMKYKCPSKFFDVNYYLSKVLDK